VHASLSVINNLKLGLVDLDPALFPGAPPSSDIKVHDGFQDTFLRTANEILDGVRRVLTEESLSRVIITGHSLGAFRPTHLGCVNGLMG
jgi:hypothetical protein